MNDSIKEIRKAAAAGAFYPGNAGDLTKTLAQFFSEVDKTPLSGPVMALIAPHAGYPYSGKTAAKAFKLLEGEQYDTVVIISPSHTVFFKGSSVYDGDGYQTPLGLVKIDHELSRKIGHINPLVYPSKMGHASGNTRGEHALEVQLPFLQIVLGKFKLVAIVMGDQEEESINSLGEILFTTLRGTNSLIVASTDLSHFHPEKKARQLDGEIRKAVEQYDPTLLVEMLETGRGEACGGGPMAATMIATRKMGGSSVKVLDYTTSGETSGDFDEVVGYLSAAIVGGKKLKTAREDDKFKGEIAARPRVGVDLTQEQRALLKKIAHDSIAAKFSRKKPTMPQEKWLEIQRGAFVTLTLGGDLKGCIGRIKSFDPIGETIAEMAQAAAFEDPRFTSLSKEEFSDIKIEISILSPLVRVHDFGKIKVGRDGLMIKLDMHSGLLLPQVAAEYGWDVQEFLQETCLKAGLARNAYKDQYAEVYQFTAEIF